MSQAIKQEIIDTLGRGFGPMQAREICDSMGVEATAERDQVLRILREMAAKAREVEWIDGAGYALIPKEAKSVTKSATLLERIDYRLGDDLLDPATSLLREAREEIVQLTFAAKAAIAAAPAQLSIDLDRARQVAESFGWVVDPDSDGSGLIELEAIIKAGIGKAT